MGKKKERKSKKWLPNSKQIKMAELLLNPEDRRTKQEKCKEVGITMKTLWKWHKDERFLNYMNSQQDKFINSELPEIWKALILQCKRGNIAAIKEFFRLKGMYPEQKDQW